jgi:Apea-like HEPN
MSTSCTAYALVRHIESAEDELTFRDFRLWRAASPGLVRDAQEFFPGTNVQLHNEWIYERHYANVPLNFGSVPFDVLETLLLLRLFRTGELSFVRHTVRDASGEILRQWPQRTMTEMYAPYSRYYVLQQSECSSFDAFADSLRRCPAWHSAWFKTAQRYFLYGTAKEFEVAFGIVDRVLDYMIAMEAAFVPEREYVGRRLRERAMSVIHESESAKGVLKRFYDVRSDIAHGASIGEDRINFLKDKMENMESWVRRSLVAAIQTLSADEAVRTEQLKQVYDISDADRLETVRTAVHQVRPASLKKVLVKALNVIIGKQDRR